MNIKQKQSAYVKVKYSEMGKRDPINNNARTPVNSAENALHFLLQVGYAVMSSYNINEVQKLIRSLRELGKEFTMKAIESPNENISGDKRWRDMYYEFTTTMFEDDRGLPLELSNISYKTLANELKSRYQKTEVKKDESKRDYHLICPSGKNGFISYNGESKKQLDATDTVLIIK